MTTESRDKDSRLSAAYRDLATERTPPALDEKVLSMAADNARTKFGITRVWVRPVAWAATIGLSLAIVLQLTQYPTVEEPEPATPELRTDSDALGDLEETVVKDEDKVRAEPASAPARTSASEEFRTDDMAIVREAEEQAHARSGSEDVAAGQAEALSLDAALPSMKKELAWRCDSDARSAVASWYACIERLRDNGLSDAADEELEQLVLEYPDFEAPEEDR